MSFLLFQGSTRVAPVQQPAIAPPFDPSDQYGEVHTTPPPSWQPPAQPYFMLADFTGVTIPGDYMGNPTTDGEVRIVSGPYTGLTIPFLVGANSTPPTMIMTPMLPMYPAPVQDAFLTEYLQRGYQDFVMAPSGWNFDQNGYHPSPNDLVAWAGKLKNLGLRVILWNGDPNGPLDALSALWAARCVDFYIVGEEIDSKMPAEALPPLLDRCLAITGRMLPIGVHFTATQFVDASGNRIPNGGSYPIGFPRETFLAGGATGSWADYNGLVHLCNQIFNDESAGLQGSLQGYAMRRVNLGMEGGDGRPAMNSRVYAFETMATSQLYGRCTELYGKLRSLELNYCPPGLSGVQPIAGSGNGISEPDGWQIPT